MLRRTLAAWLMVLVLSATAIASDKKPAMPAELPPYGPLKAFTAPQVAEHKLDNVEYVLATDKDPRLPEHALDLVFIAYAYHEFGDPEAIMAAVKRSLKPGGKVLILEYAKESNIAPASPLHKMSFEEIRREIEPMGFAIDGLLDFLPVQHGVIFAVE